MWCGGLGIICHRDHRANENFTKARIGGLYYRFCVLSKERILRKVFVICRFSALFVVNHL